MSVEKVSFKGVEAPQLQPQEKLQFAFKGQENPVDEEKSNATKYMIGATALAGVIALGIAGYKGHLGEGIQKFLGGAEKAAKKESIKTSMTTTTSTVSQSVNEASENVAQEVKTILTGEEAIKSINEYFAKFEPNSKAFVPKNNKDIVIVIRKSDKNILSKHTYKLEDFKWNASASEIKAESISGAMFESGIEKNSKVNMKLLNGSYVEIERLGDYPGANAVDKGIRTEISNPEKHRTYYKTVTNGMTDERIIGSYDGNTTLEFNRNNCAVFDDLKTEMLK